MVHEHVFSDRDIIKKDNLIGYRYVVITLQYKTMTCRWHPDSTLHSVMHTSGVDVASVSRVLY